MESTWLKKGIRVRLCSEWADPKSRPITGTVVGAAGEYIAIVWDHRPNAIMPGLVEPDELAPVDPLQKLAEID